MWILHRSTDSTGPGGRPSVAAAASSPLTSREVLLPPQPPHQPGPRRSKEVLGSPWKSYFLNKTRAKRRVRSFLLHQIYNDSGAPRLGLCTSPALGSLAKPSLACSALPASPVLGFPVIFLDFDRIS